MSSVPVELSRAMYLRVIPPTVWNEGPPMRIFPSACNAVLRFFGGDLTGVLSFIHGQESAASAAPDPQERFLAGGRVR